MLRHTPMNRGKGFKRPERVRQPASPLSKVHGGVRAMITDAMLRRTAFKKPQYEPPPAAPLCPLERPVVLARIETKVTAMPKTEPHRNRALLDLANGKPCLLRVKDVCVGGTETTVACHSNKSTHGKAGARKANDEYSVWGCWACHAWLDTGKAPQHFKDTLFMTRHADQVIEWRRIAADPSQPARNRFAARWALDHLFAVYFGATVS